MSPRKCIFLVSLLLMLPMIGQAQDDFAVTVPGRNATADGLPISRIRITLEFSGAVPSSLELKRLNPSSTATLQIPPQSFGNGDHVKFKQEGSNTVEIELQPRSNFNDWVANKCQRRSGGTGEFAMQLRDPSAANPSAILNDITGYRITSYRALSNPYGCRANQTHRRISVTPATWKAGKKPPGTDLGRHPVRIAMVLDESGSMGTQISGGGGSRMEKLKTEAGKFIDTWGVVTNAPAEDRLGVVMFTTGVRTLGGGSSFFKERGSGSGNSVPSSWQSISSDISSASPQQSTAMGDGLKKAYDELSGEENVSIVLFTDGIENAGAYRTKPCSEISSAPCLHLDEMNLYSSGQSDRISMPAGPARQVQTIAIGAPGSRYVVDLDAIATQTGGKNTSGLRREVMSKGFGDALLDILNAETLQRIFRVSARLAEGRDSGLTRTMQVNRSAEQLIVRLSWDEFGNRNALNLSFEGPNGQSRSPDTRLRRAGYQVASFNLESGDAGEWRVRVDRGDSAGDLNYDLSALVDEAIFRYQLSWHQNHYFTGDQMHLVVTPTENGRPTSELDPSDLEVNLARPSEGLGTLMHKNKTPESEPGGGDNPGTAYGQKLQFLLDERGIGEQIQPRPVEASIQIRDSVITSDGETIGGTGHLVVTLPTAKVPGTYRVRLQIDGELEQSGVVERTDEVETQVALRPNLANSEVEAKAQGDSLLVQFVPRSRYGDFLGPGYESRLGVTCPLCESPYPISVSDEETRGTYRMVISDVQVEENPRLIFRLNGRPYHAVTTEQLVAGDIPAEPNLEEGGGGGIGCSCDMGNDKSTNASIPVFFLLMVFTFTGRTVYRRLFS